MPHQDEIAYAVRQDGAGNFIVVGTTGITGSACLEGFCSGNVWLVKLDPQGHVLWQKSCGGQETPEWGLALEVTDDDRDGRKDGGLIVAGAATAGGSLYFDS